VEIIGCLSSLFHYPVKSMAGESIRRGELLADGLAEDRLYAFESTGVPVGMLRLTGLERRAMLRHQAQTREDGTVRVKGPAGVSFDIESSSLLQHLHETMPRVTKLSLTRSSKP
jgi:uncharacterized protein YcbX